MAVEPSFAATVRTGSALLGNAETNLQVPTTTSTIITAGASGTKIEEIVLEATTTSLVPVTVAGLVYVFLHDGTTYHLYDTLVVTAVTASSSAVPFRYSKTYTNLWMPTSWSVRCSQSIAGNASILKCTIFGGDF